MHKQRAPVAVRRFALGATAEIKLARDRRQRSDSSDDGTVTVHTQFRAPGGARGPAGVGFEAEVDGLCIRFHVPAMTELAERSRLAESSPSWRAAYLLDLIQSDDELPDHANTFLRGWLHQIFLSALVTIAAERGCTLPDARTALLDGDATSSFAVVMDGIFHIEPHADGDDDDSHETSDLLRERLTGLLGDPDIVRRLGELATALWETDEAGWAEWLAGRLHETLGEATRAACFEVAPRHAAEGSLQLDLGKGLPSENSPPGTVEVWLTESALGGAGVIEAIEDAYATQPRRFFQALEAALMPGDAELTAVGLDRVAELAGHDGAVAQAMEAVRAQRNPEGRDRTIRELYALLSRVGVFMDHGTSVALNQRLLRDGTDAPTDELFGELVAYWWSLEDRLGVGIDLRVFCYVATQTPIFGDRLAELVELNTGREASLALIHRRGAREQLRLGVPL